MVRSTLGGSADVGSIESGIYAHDVSIIVGVRERGRGKGGVGKM